MSEFLQKHKEKIFTFMQFLVFYLIGFGIMFNRHYSPDSYLYYRNSNLHYKAHLITARIGAYLAAFLFKDVNIIVYEKFFVLLLIVTLTISSTMIFHHYLKWCSEDIYKRYLLKTAIAIMYGNVFMIDFFHFPEAIPPMACGILFMSLAVLQVASNMTIRRTLFIILFMTISLNCYQVTLGFFCFFALIDIYSYNKGKLTVSAFRDSIVVLFGGCLPGVFNVILLRVFQNIGIVALESRTQSVGLEGWVSNAKMIFKGAYDIFKDSWGFLPQNSLLIMLLILYLLIIVTLWKRQETCWECLYIVLLIIACRSLLYLPHLLASSVWMAPRSIISYWSIVAIPCVILVVLADSQNIKIATLAAMSCFCIINILYIQKIGLNLIVSNRLDEEIAYMVQDRIKDYENESGKEINTILFRNDAVPTYNYRALDFKAFEIGQRAYTTSWSCVEMINYYNGENYKYEYMDDETFNQFFENNDWDELDLDEQLVFDGETAYFAIY